MCQSAAVSRLLERGYILALLASFQKTSFTPAPVLKNARNKVSAVSAHIKKC